MGCGWGAVGVTARWCAVAALGLYCVGTVRVLCGYCGTGSLALLWGTVGWCGVHWGVTALGGSVGRVLWGVAGWLWLLVDCGVLVLWLYCGADIVLLVWWLHCCCTAVLWIVAVL